MLHIGEIEIKVVDLRGIRGGHQRNGGGITVGGKGLSRECKVTLGGGSEDRSKVIALSFSFVYYYYNSNQLSVI